MNRLLNLDGSEIEAFSLWGLRHEKQLSHTQVSTGYHFYSHVLRINLSILRVSYNGGYKDRIRQSLHPVSRKTLLPLSQYPSLTAHALILLYVIRTRVREKLTSGSYFLLILLIYLKSLNIGAKAKWFEFDLRFRSFSGILWKDGGI